MGGYRLGAEWPENHSAEKDLGCWLAVAEREPRSAQVAKKANGIPSWDVL